MKRIVLLFAALLPMHTVHAQRPPSGQARSFAGHCSGNFGCDQLTVANLNDGKVLIQLSQAGGDILGWRGTVNAEDPALLELDQVYLASGRLVALSGHCTVVFQPEIVAICTSPGTQVVFTTTEGK